MDNASIIPRIGTFFLVMGIAAIIFFIASDLAETVYYDLFFVGILLSAFGIFLRRKAAPPPSSGRFETWRKMRTGEGKKKNKKKDNE